MKSELALRYSAPVPRYTSYPTAPHFSAAVGAADVERWLQSLSAGSELSLYVHIPFCAQLCWYCGCSTKVVNRYEPIAHYLTALEREIAKVASLVPKQHTVRHIHWGGGSPNVLSPDDIRGLAGLIRKRFSIAEAAEFAVEIDPRGLDAGRVDAFRDTGVDRISIGVQDFDPEVQKAINRVQSLEMTRDAVAMFRSAGIGSINIDLVYGLPHQSRVSVQNTIEDVLSLAPDRIAIFGYAHLPERIKHQRLIDDAALPGATERLGQANRVARILASHDYVRVGLDHFARTHDPLAQGNVKRNFQGYTTDRAQTLIGLGATAIGRFRQGYAQNAANVQDYVARVESCGLATARGLVLSKDDEIRAFVIEKLMCDLTFSSDELREQFGDLAQPVIAVAADVLDADQDGLVERTPDGFRLTDVGRPFVRSVCACFDAYLGQTPARHSAGV
ncbi:MAG: oxygen-independent coproporphyrinogen III oxidase [Hyphomicrobium sp.]|jgi:oxygen-independent coproporphyrinogen-3 oxidase